MGITFNGGTMRGTFNAQAAFMRGAATIRPPAPMPAGVRPRGGAHSHAPGRLAQPAPRPALVGTLGSARSSPPGHLAQLAPRSARGAAVLFASVRDALPAGRDVMEGARGLGAPAAIGISVAASLSGCSRSDLGNVLIFGCAGIWLVVLGPMIAISKGMERVRRGQEIEEVTELYGKRGLKGVKDALNAGHSQWLLSKYVFGWNSVLKALVEIMVDEEAGSLANGSDRKRRALAFENVKRSLETKAVLTSRLYCWWEATSADLRVARAHLKQMMIDEGFIGVERGRGVKRIAAKCEYCDMINLIDDDGPHKCRNCGAPLNEGHGE